MTDHSLELKNVSKKIGHLTILGGVNLKLDTGKIGVLAGESGSGKTTIIRIIAGLESPNDGEVIICGKESTTISAKERNVGLVFQDYALFPHLTVTQNIAFGLRKASNNEKQQRVDSLLNLVNLKDIAKRFPHQLSGGQQQRVAIARALAPRPAIILFDEPFSNLDSIQKRKLREQIKTLIKETKSTALIVTHDIDDAMRLADEIFIIQHGKVVQSGTPKELRHSPTNSYVAELVNHEHQDRS